MLFNKFFSCINTTKYLVNTLKNSRSKYTYSRKMKLVFDPALKGNKELNRDLFKTSITVSAIKIRKIDLIKVRRLLKNYSFDKIISCKRFTNLDESDKLFESHKYIFLDPDTFNYENLDTKLKEELDNILKQDENKTELATPVEQKAIDLEYTDFKFEDVVKAVIPDELLKENVNIKGYSVIGHIAHFNLREKILAYKNLIGK